MPMLMLLSSLMPLSRPATIEVTATAVSTPMMSTLRVVPFSQPKSSFSPAPICEVPSPIETATPKSVPRIAVMSMARPIGP